MEQQRVGRPFEGIDAIATALLTATALVLGRIVKSAGWADGPAARNWLTVFVAVSMQAFPFLVLGVAVSGAIATVLPPELLQRVLPKRARYAVPVAGLAGVALPGCECASVPIAGRLIAGGAPPPAALAFLLAAPAINPIVLIATAVAFPNRPEIVLARFIASLATAIIVGLVWSRRERTVPTISKMGHDHGGGSRFSQWTNALVGDFVHACGYLVLGAATAATLQTVIPRSVLDTLARNGIIAVLTMGVLAVILAVCSEADAFVASGLQQFSLTARLVFLVVGPAVDVKLVAMQVATFGRSFALRFASLTFTVAVATSTIVGMVLL